MMTPHMAFPTDEVLVLRAQLGDRAALTELIERWQQPVWQFLHHHALDPAVADDLAQDTWLAVLRSLAGLRQPERFRPWLFTIARRAATDRLRRRYRRPPGPVADPGDGDAGPPLDDRDVAEQVADRELIRAYLDRLDVRERLAVSLHYLNDLSIADTAAVLAVPEGTVKSRLARARRQLNQANSTDKEKRS